jgi:hypothetical protein
VRCSNALLSLVGLDQSEVRQWQAWYRAITLAMLALAFLVVIRHLAHQATSETTGLSPVQAQPPFQSLKFVLCCRPCSGWSNQPFVAFWPGLVGADNTRLKPTPLIPTANNAFSLKCALSAT